MQNLLSLSLPLHAVPFPFGDGLLQLRSRVCVAAPHVAEHGEYALKADQPPFTMIIGVASDKEIQLHTAKPRRSTRELIFVILELAFIRGRLISLIRFHN